MGLNHNEIISKLAEKSVMKYQVYDNTYKVFEEIKKIFAELVNETRAELSKLGKEIPVEHKERGEFEVEMKAAGDLLLATMHTNIFEFPRAHTVQQSNYVQTDKNRSYCGIISIYNFLADSFKYNRINDVGYLVARIFINKENHFFVEGKQRLGFLYNDFSNNTINPELIRDILETCLLYSIDFDLLVPPYDNVKEVSVQEMNFITSSISLKTGKRLGFRFESEKHDVK